MVTVFRLLLGGKRTRVVERLRQVSVQGSRNDDDVLQRPFLDRTFGALARSIAARIRQATPSRVLSAIDARLARAGNPRNMRAAGFMSLVGILVPATLVGCFLLLERSGIGAARAVLVAAALAGIAGYLPWFFLGKTASKRQKEIRLSLPDIMDLLVVSVEAGLAFDMALMRVVERYRGPVSVEFQRVLREMQLGRGRKDALRDMADRLDIPELNALVSAVIQAEQLGVGVSGVLSLQSDLTRDKRQQLIEEMAMKAPVKMLFPLVFLIFPSLLIVILGPAVLSIMQVLGGMAKE